jgi:hypothetical protein
MVPFVWPYDKHPNPPPESWYLSSGYPSTPLLAGACDIQDHRFWTLCPR